MIHSQEEINKMMDDEKVEIIIKAIQDAIKNKDEKQINGYINDIAQNIKFLIKNINQDKFLYIIIKRLNKIIATDSRIRNNICQNLDESIADGIDEINFEKEALLELRNYLKNSKKNKIYKDLPLSFSILLCIFLMHKQRDKKICNDGDIWSSAIKGITYIPATQTNSRTDELREVIQKGISDLKK